MDWNIVLACTCFYLAAGLASVAGQLIWYKEEITAVQVMNSDDRQIQIMASIITIAITVLVWPALVYALLTGGFSDED